ncbi:MAG: hypothetical protein DRI98_13900 [Bacteroidetes bacterium]|nr:MAG: hypothetical protein DRI98_13900 [Bacteroidota bacterium]
MLGRIGKQLGGIAGQLGGIAGSYAKRGGKQALRGIGGAAAYGVQYGIHGSLGQRAAVGAGIGAASGFIGGDGFGDVAGGAALGAGALMAGPAAYKRYGGAIRGAFSNKGIINRSARRVGLASNRAVNRVRSSLRSRV